MHYTGMAAAIFAPGSICTVASGAIHDTWLAGIIAFNTVIVLLVTVSIAFYDARLADQNTRAAQALKVINEEHLERTRRAEQSEVALRESEARFRSLLESALDAIVIVDHKGKIVLVNSQTERLFGYARAELLDNPIEILIPKRYREKHVDHRRSFLAHSGVRPMGTGLELQALRRDGAEFPVQISGK